MKRKQFIAYESIQSKRERKISKKKFMLNKLNRIEWTKALANNKNVNINKQLKSN